MSEFAKRQLKKHGWSEGRGLGKQEDGRSEPIKVSLKMDKTGVGHDPGKEFTDHWWLRVFNEAAQKIGNKQQDSKTDEGNEIKQNENIERKNNLYKNFVKSSTLTNGIEEKNRHSDSSSEDSCDNDTSVPTLDDIHKFCGGATGHKAARFGIKMGGKLARVAEHDKMFEEGLEKDKLSQEMPTIDNCANIGLPGMVDQKSSTLCNGSVSDKQITYETVCIKTKKKKYKKHKKDKRSQNEYDGGEFSKDLTDAPCDRVDDVVSETVCEKKKPKKHKKNKYNANNSSDNDLPEYNNSQKKIIKENISDNELYSESKSKKKIGEDRNKLLDESGSKRKKKIEENISNNDLLDKSGSKRKKKTEGNISSNDLLDKSGSKRKKRAEENISSNDLSDESVSKRKKAKTNISSNDLLDESGSKRKKRTEEHISSNDLPDESKSKRKKKAKEI